MTIDRAKTIEMAHESGAVEFIGVATVQIHHQHSFVFTAEELERFAALVRAQVIEEAAQACEQMARDDMLGPVLGRSIRLAAALRGMKSDSGHSAARAGEASTTPAPEGGRA